ncbi:hypothetical protein FRB99_007657 [Tulasnella sp. 403]|nr:hypothetical protein FRB99_007657 [Tulasnella sp. 403]
MVWDEESEGKSHEITWKMTLRVGDTVLGSGTGAKKKYAREEACKAALQRLGILKPDPE